MWANGVGGPTGASAGAAGPPGRGVSLLATVGGGGGPGVSGPPPTPPINNHTTGQALPVVFTLSGLDGYPSVQFEGYGAGGAGGDGTTASLNAGAGGAAGNFAKGLIPSGLFASGGRLFITVGGADPTISPDTLIANDGGTIVKIAGGGAGVGLTPGAHGSSTHNGGVTIQASGTGGDGSAGGGFNNPGGDGGSASGGTHAGPGGSGGAVTANGGIGQYAAGGSGGGGGGDGMNPPGHGAADGGLADLVIRYPPT